MFSLSLSATDANSLSLTWGQSGLPAGLTLNATSGLIHGTILAGAANAGAATPVITVSDGTDVASESFTWTPRDRPSRSGVSATSRTLRATAACPSRCQRHR